MLNKSNKWLLTYFLFLHIILATVVLKSNFISLVERKLGLSPTEQIFAPYYKTLVSFHQRIDKNLPDDVVIFIGDSHTQGLATAAVYDRTVNYGIASDTTTGVINRIPLYTTINQAKAIILEIGTNDLFKTSNEAIISNIKKILNVLPQFTPVIVNAIFPMDEVRANQPGINQRIKAINNAVHTVVMLQKNSFFLNINPILTDKSQQLSKNYHLGDGIHLNKKGYAIWINALHNQLSLIDNIRSDREKQ